MSFFKKNKKETEFIQTQRQPERQIKYVYVTYLETSERMYLVTYDDETFIEPHTQMSFHHIRGGSDWEDAVATSYKGEQVEYEGSEKRLEETIVINNRQVTVASALKEYLGKNRELMEAKIYASMEKQASKRYQERMKIAQTRQATPQVTQSERDDIMRTLQTLERGRTQTTSSRDEVMQKILRGEYKSR